MINALKHAFPRDRGGDILVSYKSRASEWTLSVRDDGVGMPVGQPPSKGLGTSIVEALAKQLHATVEMSDAEPGTRVAIVHRVAPGGGARAALAVPETDDADAPVG